MKKIAIILSSFFLSFGAMSQDYSTDFSWVPNIADFTNAQTASVCAEQGVTYQITTSPYGHVLDPASLTGAYIPEDPTDTGTVHVRIDFDHEVCNLRLLLHDFDDIDASTDIDRYMGNLAEYGDNFNPAFSSISFAGGNFFIAPSMTRIEPPLNVINTRGWVEWNDPVTFIEFDYIRQGSVLQNNSAGWGLILEAMEFDCCGLERPCPCPPNKNFLTGTSSSIASDGAETITVNLNSGGMPVTQLNISMLNYDLLTDLDCIKCEPGNIDQYGKIQNLPPIAGVFPEFAENGTSSAYEIAYLFDTPTMINTSINLQLQFPESLDLSCCDNEIDYCLKVSQVDVNCMLCEAILCLDDSGGSTTGGGSSGSGSGGGQGGNKSNTDQSSFQKDEQNFMLFPNPVLNELIIRADETGELVITDLSGKVVAKHSVRGTELTVSTYAFARGTYVAQFTSVDGVTSSQTFIKE